MLSLGRNWRGALLVVFANTFITLITLQFAIWPDWIWSLHRAVLGIKYKPQTIFDHRKPHENSCTGAPSYVHSHCLNKAHLLHFCHLLGHLHTFWVPQGPQGGKGKKCSF